MTELIKVIETPIRPDIGAVVRNKDRNVTDDLHSTLIRVPRHPHPLTIEDVLQKPLLVDRRRIPLLKIAEGCLIAIAQVGLPPCPFLAGVPILDRSKERVVVQPPRRLRTERLITASKIPLTRVASQIPESGIGQLKEPLLALNHRSIVDAVRPVRDP
ncbi:MAG: hypothetical protein RIR86_3181 [Acidobacteriota bacterium]